MDIPIITPQEMTAAIHLTDAFYVLTGVLILVAWSWIEPRRLPNPGKLRLPKLPVIIALAALIRIPNLFDSFWYDETFSAAMASLSFDDLGAAIIADVHPPFYYWIQWAVEKLIGTSEVALRLPAYLAGVASVWMMYHLTVALLTTRPAKVLSVYRARQIGLIAALIIALLPAHIRYSAEARGYALLALLLIVGLHSGLRRRALPFIAAVGLLPLIHNHGYLYAAALGAGGLAMHRRSWVLPVLSAGVPGLVWLPTMLQQAAHVGGEFWMLPLSAPGVVSPLLTMSGGQGYNVPVDLLIMGGVFVATFAGVWTLKRFFRPSPALAAWMAAAVGVPLAAALMSWLWSPVYLHRALMPAVMLFVPLWALGMHRYRGARILCVVALVAALIGHFGITNRRDDLRAWMSCEGDAVYVLSTSTAISALYYAPVAVYVAPESDDRNQALPDEIKSLFGLQFAHLDDLPYNSLCIYHVFNAHDGHRARLDAILSASDYRADLRYSNDWMAFVSYEVVR